MSAPHANNQTRNAWLSRLRALAPQWVVQAYRARHEARKYAPPVELLHEICPRNCVALDIGANHGGYTWELRNIASEVHAFEPNPALAWDLCFAFALDWSVHVHRVALSDTAGEATLRVPTASDGLATIACCNGLSGLPVREIPVRVAMLDNYRLEDVGFIKIDVEGHELAVLHGARELLRRDRPTLLIEAAEQHRPGAVASVWKFLQPFGYRGWFSFGDARWDISAFELAVHQNLANIDELGRRHGEFTADFVFE